MLKTNTLHTRMVSNVRAVSKVYDSMGDTRDEFDSFKM